MPTDQKIKRARSSNSFVSVIISWLERMVVVQTLPGAEDEQELQQTIQEVRALLDEADEQEPKSC